MKYYLIFSLLLFLVLSCTSENGKEKIDNSSENEEAVHSKVINRDTDSVKIEFLMSFYKQYILLMANYIEIEPLEKLRETSCYKYLLTKIDLADIDYDPFLNAQDAIEESIKSLEVTKCGNEKDIFCVSYQWDSLSEKTIIKLQVSIIDGTPKIVDIIGL